MPGEGVAPAIQKVAGTSVDLYQYLIPGKDENYKLYLLPSGFAHPEQDNKEEEMNDAEKRAALESELYLLKKQLDRTAHRIDVVIRSIKRLSEARTYQRRTPQPQQPFNPASIHTTKECRRKLPDRRVANLQV